MSNRILIVEDEYIIALDLKMQLASNGYDVESVSSGNDAIKANENIEFDLILMDISIKTCAVTLLFLNETQTVQKFLNQLN
ncbi:response regulator [candidate division KSB1 bacterium]|nr:response regulator [candidate division KSB1 bacterium]